ncbi:sialate O-acetylesterase [Bythopirellula polymerisocia]|uniref:Sialate O-acetylesterase domain-containing protein n=1 Tax=Bythopirellula polymerisocia TaxID=2528003 RepID=A0A5C6CVW1_9BACT|nr:sialate O-acetylesterase [Bythopirellula polymerisocia]TWU27581.1 hypothetical protein Pla144_23580 [Bythopirellula polymerisocia]
MKSMSEFPVLLLLSVFVTTATADVCMHGLFNDNMVLQQGTTIPVWGRADPGEKVTVQFAGQTKMTVADEKGDWLLRLGPLATTKDDQSLEMTIAGTNTITIKNILVGEVWLCSGQSNMGRCVNTTTTGPAAAMRATNRLVRLCKVNSLLPNETNSPRREVESAGWLVADPENTLNFSAAAYYFGRELQNDLGVPVGVIDSSVGGSAIREWVPRDEIKSNSAFRADLDRVKNSQDDARLGTLFNRKLAPLIPFAIKGVLWYQGESDASRYLTYQAQLEALISSWRRNWGKGDLPFLVVELPPFVERTGLYYPNLWDAQQKILRVPNTGLINGLGVGSFFDIHPPNKEPLGPRSSRVAQQVAYKREGIAQEPTYRSQRIEGDKIVLTFENVGGGLVARSGKELVGFTMAGKEGNFVPAIAEVVGSNVVVSSPKVRKPVTVRYEGSVNGNIFEVFFEDLVRDETRLTLDPDRIGGTVADDAVFHVANVWGHYFEPKSVEITEVAVVIIPDLRNREANHPTTLCYSRKVDGKIVTTTFTAMEVSEGNCIIPHDRLPGDRLTTISSDGRLAGFAIAGEDKEFVDADARIIGDTVVVCSPEIEHPVGVRYGWYSLFNRMDVEDGKCVIRDCNRVRVDGFADAVKRGDLQGFTVAGADGKFYAAQAKPQDFVDSEADGGKTRHGLIILSKRVADPTTMRWNGKRNPFKVWALPPISLYNQENLPSGGFRTDDFAQ